jgi:hypothetical protein
MTTATKPADYDFTAWSVENYSSLLEDCTGYTVQVATDDEGEHCYQLVDAYGDADGDPWYFFADLVADTFEAIFAHLKTEQEG